MKVGVLGAGSAGMRHIRNALDLGCEVNVCDPHVVVDLPGTTMIARDYIFDRSDAIVSATPTHHHIGDLWSAILRGKPCLIEKPIASIGQSSEVGVALRQAMADNIPVATGFNLRFHPMVQQAKRIENPFWLSLACCQHTERTADGVLNHWASHEIDLAQYLAGPLRLMHAYVANNTADLEFLTWETERYVHVHSDMRAHHPLRTAVVVSDSDSLILDLEANPVTDKDYKTELAEFLLLTKNPDISYRTIASGWDGWSVLKLCERAMHG